MVATELVLPISEGDKSFNLFFPLSILVVWRNNLISKIFWNLVVR